jgi:hypothetical protein
MRQGAGLRELNLKIRLFVNNLGLLDLVKNLLNLAFFYSNKILNNSN